MSRAPRLVPEPFQVPLCNWNLPPWLTKRGAPFPWINTVWWCLAGVALPASQRQGGENTNLYILPDPQKCCRRAQTETEKAPKLSGSKFIKQASSNSADSSPKTGPQEQRGPSLYTVWSRLQKWGIHLLPYIITCYFIGCFNLWGKMTLLWSPDNIPQLWFFFVSLYHSLTLIIIYYLPSPSLSFCHFLSSSMFTQS
jgi:hypothetical protein